MQSTESEQKKAEGTTKKRGYAIQMLKGQEDLHGKPENKTCCFAVLCCALQSKHEICAKKNLFCKSITKDVASGHGKQGLNSCLQQVHDRK